MPDRISAMPEKISENRYQDARWDVRIDANRMPEENIRNYDQIIYHGGDHSK